MCKAGALWAVLLAATAARETTPALRFDGAVRGCGDAFVVAEGGAHILTVRLDRRRLSLTTTPRAFRIEDAPAGLEVRLYAYAKPPGYTEHCTDLAPPPDVVRTEWRARRGRVTVALSKEPKRYECYEVDLRLDGVVFADGGREIALP